MARRSSRRVTTLLGHAAALVLAGCGSDGEGADSGSSSSGASTGTTAGAGPTTDGPTTTPAATTDTADSAASTGASGGSSGSSGEVADASSSSGGFPPGSAGCGVAPDDPPETWSPHNVEVDGVIRRYDVYLPANYNPQRPYPVVYQFHGCSDSEDRQHNNPPVQDSSGEDAIHIRGRAIADCWQTGPEGAGMALFDALVPEVETAYCADAERRFATGYSSGAYMVHQLACRRGDVLRGVGSIAGGVPGSLCAGQVGVLLIHDADDPLVNISVSENARGGRLMTNGCDAKTEPTPVDPEPCAVYAGCDPGFDVVWCETQGQEHGRQDEFAGPAFWNFLAALQ